MKDLCREEPSLNAIFFAMSVYKCPFSQSPAILKSCFCHAKTDLDLSGDQQEGKSA